jgi:uncharacterized repeat protein (TIGR03806 family)
MRPFQKTKCFLFVCTWVVGLGLATQAACSTDAVSQSGEPQGDAPRALCRAWPRPASNSRIKLVPSFTNLSFPRPIGLFQAPGDDTRWYEVDQTGSIQTFANTPDVTTSTELLATPLAVELGVTEEGGLLGFAFHPDYGANGTAFLAYTVRTAGNPGLTQRIARYKRNGAGLLAKDVDIFEQTVPRESVREEHNLGSLVFGADRLLYIGLGDAYVLGSDPANPAQNLASLFGKILRIAVEPSGPYRIPPGNPYATGGGAPEIYARGFRNPWRFSFDRGNPKHLWVGEVGDDTWEEINRVEIGRNYGWSVMEGPVCHGAATCNPTGIEPPVVAYAHKQGLLAVIGGYVYRGTQYPALYGSYFYADFSGRIWSLPNGQSPPKTELETGLRIVSFAEDNQGELFVLAFESLTAPAKIFRIVGVPPGAPSQAPKTLSATGCVDPNAPTNPAPTLIPFDVNSPLWSDGAEKNRWLSLPPGTTIHVREDGRFELPIGSVLMKEFRLSGKPVETRLLLRHLDGDFGGYSYEWAEDGQDAQLLDDEKSKIIAGSEWLFPSPIQCLRCHTVEAGRSLGLEIAQLNKTHTYPQTGRTVNQLVLLGELGLLDKPLGDPSLLPRLADPYGNDSPDSRARSYLHANCSFCHRPGASPQTQHDLLFSTRFASMNVCNAAPLVSDLGYPNMRLLAPGDPARSLLSVRMQRLDGMRMPPLASSQVDLPGVRLVNEWIRSITACP